MATTADDLIQRAKRNPLRRLAEPSEEALAELDKVVEHNKQHPGAPVFMKDAMAMLNEHGWQGKDNAFRRLIKTRYGMSAWSGQRT